MKHVFQLRVNFTVEVALPDDLSMQDVQRLTLWLRALPFDQRVTRTTAGTPAPLPLKGFRPGKRGGA